MAKGCYNPIFRNISGLAILLVFLAALNVFAFEEDLKKLLSKRRETPEEKASKDIVTLKLREGQPGSALYVMPRQTFHAFMLQLFDKGEFSKVVSFCDEYLKFNPEEHLVLYIQALSLEALGDANGAIAKLERAHAITPQLPDKEEWVSYFYLYGLYKYDKNDSAKADLMLSKFNDRYNSLAIGEKKDITNFIIGPLKTLITFYTNQKKDFDKGIACAQMILILDLQNVNAKYNLAVNYINKSMRVDDQYSFAKGGYLLEEIITTYPTSQEAGLSKELITKIKKFIETGASK